MYTVPFVPPLTAFGKGSAIVAGMAFGVVGMLFADSTHALSALLKRKIAYAPVRPLIGGAVVAILATIFNVPQYLGLGIPTIVQAFTAYTRMRRHPAKSRSADSAEPVRPSAAFAPYALMLRSSDDRAGDEHGPRREHTQRI
ncbi:hypothetical protein LMG28138_05069 [Pararobbsia alpina]|uniref:Uncharacterized protein n=1 Tax=Pararobbsia alpina TaxID=621374 RepID=A0A6S7BIX8_9BURK|nr:hypothetical protein LMG28138_05069 [Pararobbsia alpina]